MKTVRITNKDAGAFFDIRDANTGEVIRGVRSFRIDCPVPGEPATATLTILLPEIDITADLVGIESSVWGAAIADPEFKSGNPYQIHVNVIDSVDPEEIASQIGSIFVRELSKQTGGQS